MWLQTVQHFREQLMQAICINKRDNLSRVNKLCTLRLCVPSPLWMNRTEATTPVCIINDFATAILTL